MPRKKHWILGRETGWSCSEFCTDGHNQYGFKYDESTNKYSGKALSEYVRGYRKGYKEGWAEGLEDLEDRFNMGDPEIDEGDW